MIWGDAVPSGAVPFTASMVIDSSDHAYMKERGVLAAGGILFTGSTLNPNVGLIGTSPRWIYEDPTAWVHASSTHGASIVDGKIYTFAATNGAQLGRTTTAALAPTPGEIATTNTPNSNWKKVVCGFNHCIALKNDGTLWSWGQAGSRTGQGTTATVYTVPTQIGTANDWTDIFTAEMASFAFKGNALYSWGAAVYTGQNLGSGDVTTPTLLSGVAGGGTITWAYGAYNNAFLVADGKLFSTGANANYVTGLGTNSGTALVFTQVGSATDWARGYCHTYCGVGLRTNGIAYGFGGFNSTQHAFGSSAGQPTAIGGNRIWAACGPVKDVIMSGTGSTNYGVGLITQSGVLMQGGNSIHGWTSGGTTNPPAAIEILPSGSEVVSGHASGTAIRVPYSVITANGADMPDPALSSGPLSLKFNSLTVADSGPVGYAITQAGTEPAPALAEGPFPGTSAIVVSGFAYFYPATDTRFDMSAGQPFTTEGWFYQTDTSGTQTILGYRGASSASYTVSIMPNGSLRFDQGTGGITNASTAAGVFTPNRWNHVALSRYNNTFSIYLNGIQVFTNNTFGNPFSTSVVPMFGGSTVSGTARFKGKMALCRYSPNTLRYFKTQHAIPTGPWKDT